MARENLIYEYRNNVPKYGWMMNIEKLIELDNNKKLFFTSNGKPRKKKFLDDYEGTEIDNLWHDIMPIGQNKLNH